MQVYRNRPALSSKPVVLYDWQPAHRAVHPREFLKDFSGTVITDGYQVYHKLGKEQKDLTIDECQIHTRKPFVNFIKSLKDSTTDTIAHETYRMITEMLHIDNGFDDLPTKDRLKHRQLILSEKVDDYFTWIKKKICSGYP